MVQKILLLGNPQLYQKSESIKASDLEYLPEVVQNLHDTLVDFRNTYGAGRAIAAPQIGYFKRLIYMFIDRPVVFINPVLEFTDDEMIDVLDDCMSFPHLMVKVKRHKRCVIHYTDMNGENQAMHLEDDLAELIQHEYDHLDGILATMRAVDKYAFVAK